MSYYLSSVVKEGSDIRLSYKSNGNGRFSGLVGRFKRPEVEYEIKSFRRLIGIKTLRKGKVIGEIYYVYVDDPTILIENLIGLSRGSSIDDLANIFKTDTKLDVEETDNGLIRIVGGYKFSASL